MFTVFEIKLTKLAEAVTYVIKVYFTYVLLLLLLLWLKREGQGQTGNSSNVKSRKIKAQITEVHDTSDNEYGHRQKRRDHREDDRTP